MQIYLIRHAQSLQKVRQHFSEWTLSPTGMAQAEELASLLAPLKIARVFSSPFVRTLQTAAPFARQHGFDISIVQDLRERHITHAGPPSDEIWSRSWEDPAFCLPGCESSLDAQKRIYGAIQQIAETTKENAAVFTHGNVIGLFLGAILSGVGRKEAEALTNPDVLKIEWDEEAFRWDRKFRLTGLSRIATTYAQTPKEDAETMLAADD